MNEKNKNAHLNLVVRKTVFGVSDQVSQRDPHVYNQVRKYSEVEGLYYACSENKGTDQLRSHCEADLRHCFHICRKPVFS